MPSTPGGWNDRTPSWSARGIRNRVRRHILQDAGRRGSPTRMAFHPAANFVATAGSSRGVRESLAMMGLPEEDLAIGKGVRKDLKEAYRSRDADKAQKVYERFLDKGDNQEVLQDYAQQQQMHGLMGNMIGGGGPGTHTAANTAANFGMGINSYPMFYGNPGTMAGYG